jgi:hypothetical protein
MILIYKPKPEHIQQIVFSGFGKYEQTNKLNETASGGNPDGRFPVALYTLKI